MSKKRYIQKTFEILKNNGLTDFLKGFFRGFLVSANGLRAGGPRNALIYWTLKITAFFGDLEHCCIKFMAIFEPHYFGNIFGNRVYASFLKPA
jgi:hypothetical protein